LFGGDIGALETKFGWKRSGFGERMLLGNSGPLGVAVQLGRMPQKLLRLFGWFHNRNRRLADAKCVDDEQNGWGAKCLGHFEERLLADLGAAFLALFVGAALAGGGASSTLAAAPIEKSSAGASADACAAH
jgi:hypothetical protein